MAQATSPERRLQPASIALAVAALIAIGVLVYTTAFRGREGAVVTETNSAGAANSTADQMPNVEAMLGGLVEQVRRNPDDHEGWFRLGRAFKGLEDFPQSIQAFRRAMALQPATPDYAGY